MRDNKDLQKRISNFVDSILDLADKLPKNIINMPIIKQLIDSGTSFGANYQEACEGESSRDFVHKMKICLKELKETRYWLRLLYKRNNKFREEIIMLGQESTEFIKIFSSIIYKFKRK